MEMVVIDLCTIDKNNDEYKYLLTCKDHYSGFTWAWPQRTKEASETVWKIYKKLICRGDCPYILYTDGGGELGNTNLSKELA